MKTLLKALAQTSKAFRLGQEGLSAHMLANLTEQLSQQMPKLPHVIIEQLNPRLEETLQAISHRDFIWAADLLDYEISPLLESGLTTNLLQPVEVKMDNSNLSTTSAPEHFKLDWGVYSLLKLLQDYHFEQVLDIGSGAGEHKRFLELFGKQVYSVDLVKQADYVGDFMQADFDRRFEVIWCSHVLEHQRNVGLFLDKIYDLLTDDGILAITVPIHPKNRLISGHLTSWSIPLLCYNLIMAGFDCRAAQILETFELSLIVKKKPAQHTELRKPSAHGADAGVEFAELAPFFPFDASQGVEISGPGSINWDNFLKYDLPQPHSSLPSIHIDSKNFDNEPELKPTIHLQCAPNQG